MKSARIHPFAKQMAEQCRHLADLGFSPGLTGQVSALDNDLLWMTPQSLHLRDIQAEHLIPIWPDGSIYNPDALSPPIGLERHQALYASHPEAKAIVLARPPQACVWAATQLSGTTQPREANLPGLEQPILLLPATAQTLADTLEGLPVEWSPGDHALIAMADGGIFSLANTLPSALNQLELLESCAAVELRAARFRGASVL